MRKINLYFKSLFYFVKNRMQIEEETKFIPNTFEDYSPATADLHPLYPKLADLLQQSLREFYKKVKPTEPVSICSVKSKSTYSTSIFDGYFFFLHFNLIFYFNKDLEAIFISI